MARLRQTEPKKETIGDYNFYIKPFPAMVAANLTGDLASLLTPVLAALLPLVGNGNENQEDDNGDSGLMDIDVDQAAASMAKSMEGEDDVETGEFEQEILDMDLVNELFCGEVQDMFVLAFYVIRLNFNGFFKKLVGRFGKAGEALVKKTRQIL